MIEDDRIVLGPFQHINHCESCNWHAPRDSRFHVMTESRHNAAQATKICPACGNRTCMRVGQYAHMRVKINPISRFLFGTPSQRCWVRWRPEADETTPPVKSGNVTTG